MWDDESDQTMDGGNRISSDNPFATPVPVYIEVWYFFLMIYIYVCILVFICESSLHSGYLQ